MTRMFLVPRIRAHKALDWDDAPDRNNTSDWDEFTDADLNYYLRVASDATDSFFTIPLCLHNMSDEDACLLDTTLAALEDKCLLDEFQFLFETWRYIHDLILIIRGMFGNPSTVDEHFLQLAMFAMTSLWTVRSGYATWSHGLAIACQCPHTIILVSTHVMRSSREVWSCIIPFTNLLPCRLMASCGAYLSMHLASYTVSRAPRAGNTPKSMKARSVTSYLPSSSMANPLQVMYHWSRNDPRDQQDIQNPDPLGLWYRGPHAQMEVFVYRRIRPEFASLLPRELEDSHYVYFLHINQLPRRLNIPLRVYGFAPEDGHTYQLLLTILDSSYLSLALQTRNIFRDFISIFWAFWADFPGAPRSLFDQLCSEVIAASRPSQIGASTTTATLPQIQEWVQDARKHLPDAIFARPMTTPAQHCAALDEISMARSATPDSNEPVEMVSMWLRMFVKHTALEGFMSDVWVQDDPRGMD
ncbi:hypothetical protein OH76DRAFT_1423602 [Lentinus brumalis]|uniref:Uncharacterized protein n=1 Tax=Lentinus brumalis TaxID=2498619 RepID=A0A371CK18_9APHY|nr:hypothetical protein OH76DRAFT_1423602 [Polyporus brumalis]